MKKIFLLPAIALLAAVFPVSGGVDGARLSDYSHLPYKIVYESNENGTYDLNIMSPDASWKKKLTDTTDRNEMYPKVSPDGRLIAFTVDTGEGRTRKRDMYLMNIDGSGVRLLSENSREHCWSPDGKFIAFVKSESTRRFSIESWATKGLFIYNVATGDVYVHKNKKLEHLYALAWSPDGKYITATVLGGMGFKHTDLAIDAWGTGYFKLGIVGCRPEFNPDGTMIGWGQSDSEFRIAKINFSKRPPVAEKDKTTILKVEKGYEIYHLDWSPDGKYIAFAYGPTGDQAVGGLAKGWDIGIMELSTGKWMRITWDGNHNKEPDWVP